MVDEGLLKELLNKGIVLDTGDGFKLNPYLDMPRSLGYEDVALFQGKNTLTSRLDTNIRSEIIRGVWVDKPFISSNMSSVTNASFADRVSYLGGLGVLHRAFYLEHQYLKEAEMLVKQSTDSSWNAASIGAGEDQIDLAKKLFDIGINIIVIDIAQGYSDMVILTANALRKEIPDVKIVVGNTINPEMMYEVDGIADAVKVGIAQGSVCETKNTAGCTSKMFSVVDSFKGISKKLGLPIIADGGTKEPADAVKAIAAGANSVMMGSVFARCPESAGETVEIDGVVMKKYFGMASREAQKAWRGGLKQGTCPEGKSVLLPQGESVKDVMERYSGALRSALTYVGAETIKEFQEKVRFVRL